MRIEIRNVWKLTSDLYKKANEKYGYDKRKLTEEEQNKLMRDIMKVLTKHKCGGTGVIK